MRHEPLNGLKVLITRPCPLGDAIAQAIEERGGSAVKFPVIRISAPSSFVALDELLHGIADIDLLVFVSVAAVEGFVARQRQHGIALPSGLKMAAMGPKTAGIGRDHGLDIDFVPSARSTDSEGLLEALSDQENDIELKNARVAIARGQSGRGRLKSELERLGAEVTLVQSYTRRITDRPIQPVIDIWLNGGIDVVLITSVSILDGLFALLGAQHAALLNDAAVVTISNRIREHCSRRGIADVRVARGTSDDCLLAALADLVEG